MVKTKGLVVKITKYLRVYAYLLRLLIQAQGRLLIRQALGRLSRSTVLAGYKKYTLRHSIIKIFKFHCRLNSLQMSQI